ncbi:hypothetical protein P43SY_011914 [Pythium insidiosum]|uniref:Ribosome quality control complex subunit 2 n=1 Tax=Pythium insidiosum TaxID=114742 RepID=A0AAD5Q1Z3_PYTIN|nr:hypothetical protein P43SY_011914 [Pythium insidiosum]
MKKTRMSIDDIHAMVGSLRKNVLNMRVTNIYDLAALGGASAGAASKTYILKLHQPPFPKVFLLLESGVRFHTSRYARDAGAKNALPSQFTMKLRKHLRGKRLVALSQLEGDRVVDLTFGNDELQCHLILELYASGNIILTDDKYTILSLLRTHKFDENVKMAVRQTYPVSVLDSSKGQGGITSATDLMLAVERWFVEHERRAAEGKTAKKLKPQTLKQLLLTKDATFGGLGPVIVEHCIVSAGLQPTLKIRSSSEFKAIGVTELMRLVTELQAGWTLLEKLQSEQRTVITAEGEGAAEGQAEPVALVASDAGLAAKQGFIILAPKKNPSDPDQFEEFTPYLYAQHRAHGDESRVRAFDTFDDAVDEYFSHYEAQVAEVARQNAKAAAESKLEKLRKNQKQQIDQLLEVQEQSFRHAQLIEANQQDVENVLLVVRSALASGMDWRGLEELVHFEQKNGNPVASLIHELDLAHNRVAILLCDGDDDDDTEDDDDKQEDKQAHVIWIDLSLSALANAREIYSKKKKAGEKVKKATEATTRAIEMAAKQTKKALEKQQMKRHTIYQRRKTLWFEKFHWFLSSEQYLVIAGKDAHQNELLVKRYLRKGDVYVHADLHGAATCIVRNRVTPNASSGASDAERYPPIPVATLEQAGCMSVCRSNAWTNQVIAGAYWVHADQVSKTAPAGEYLTTGSFMIRGKKNYINPSRLEMGLAIVFRLDESSIVNHKVDTDERPSFDNARAQDAALTLVEAGASEEAGAPEEYDAEPQVEESSVGADDEAVETVENNAVEAPVDEAPVAEEGEAQAQADENHDAVAAEVKNEDSRGGRDGRKRLSAKQRRDLKKGKSIDTDSASVPTAQAKETSGGSKKPTSAKSNKGDTAPSVAAPSTNVRGKKGKLKKIKKKYADQDDEDRRVRMQALGHAIEDVDNESTAAQVEEVSGAEQANDVEGDDPRNAGASAERDETYIRQQREKKEKYLEQEEEEAEQLDFFDAFTGSPLPQDLLLHAMPMCAPYSSLLRHKYKVKLTPGSVKKGKAAKTALEYLLATNLREEKDLLSAQRRTHKPGADETKQAHTDGERADGATAENEEQGGVEHAP